MSNQEHTALLVDPQPRKDLTVPPMVSRPHSQGVVSVKTREPKSKELENIFAGLDFSGSR
jgi:hypothetical protein